MPARMDNGGIEAAWNLYKSLGDGLRSEAALRN